MRTILFVTLSMLVFGCNSAKNAVESDQSSKGTIQNDENVMITASIGRVDQASDPLSISDVRVKGNKLLIDVTYGGGCQEHQFQVIGSAMISKSLPPVRSIQLVHTSNDDMCKMNVMKTLEIDISEFAYKKENGSEIYLTLSGWSQQIEYVYED